MRQEAKPRIGSARSGQNRNEKKEARAVMIAKTTLLQQETIEDAKSQRAPMVWTHGNGQKWSGRLPEIVKEASKWPESAK